MDKINPYKTTCPEGEEKYDVSTQNLIVFFILSSGLGFFIGIIVALWIFHKITI